MKYCIFCGKQIKEGQKFCPYCGKPQSKISNSTGSKNTGTGKNTGTMAPKKPGKPTGKQKKTAHSEEGGSKKPLLLIVIIIIAAALVVGGIVLLKTDLLDSILPGSRTETGQEDEDEDDRDDRDRDEDEDLSAEEEADAEEGESADEEEELDLSDIDVDAVSDSYAEFTGVLADAGDYYEVTLSDTCNIYAYDNEGEKVIRNDVSQIVLSEIGNWDVADYLGEEVTVGGYIEVADQDVTMALEDFEGPELTEDTAIHSYRIIVEDCTWEEAMQEAQELGGYLVRINSQEEYDTILTQLNAGDYSKYHFYLGGRRDSDGSDYYWVGTDNVFIGDSLNSSSSWCQDAWYDGEPSYADGDITEDAMNLFCVGGTWYLNDSSMDLVGNYPSYLTGCVGYIVEIE